MSDRLRIKKFIAAPESQVGRVNVIQGVCSDGPNPVRMILDIYTSSSGA